MNVRNCWACFSPAPIFFQTKNPFSTKFDVFENESTFKNAVGCIPFFAKEAWTPNMMYWKWMHIQNMLLAASSFLPWRLKVEIKRVYEIADHAFTLPPTFCQTVNPISTKGADYAYYSTSYCTSIGTSSYKMYYLEIGKLTNLAANSLNKIKVL